MELPGVKAKNGILGEWNVQKYVHCSKLLTLDRDK